MLFNLNKRIAKRPVLTAVLSLIILGFFGFGLWHLSPGQNPLSGKSDAELSKLPMESLPPEKVFLPLPESAGGDGTTIKKNFKVAEEPVFYLDLARISMAPVQEKAGFFGLPVAQAAGAQPRIVGAAVLDARRQDLGLDFRTEAASGKVALHFKAGSTRPGKYGLKVDFLKDGKLYTSTQDFSWGVLALNFNKSIYLPGEKAYVQMAALTDTGHTLCGADLKLTVKDPKGQEKEYATKDGQIKRSATCGKDNVTDNPDYSLYYGTGEEGEYEFTLTNLESNSSITDTFAVKKSLPFEVERIGATRINPFKAEYVMRFKIKANEDFAGDITESVPEGFEVGSLLLDGKKLESGLSPNGGNWKLENRGDGRQEKVLVIQKISLAKGQAAEMSYRYQAPLLSPELFLLGPLALKPVVETKENEAVFAEARQWQVASDAASTTTFLSGSGNWKSPVTATITIEVWGGGGAGGGQNLTSDGGGGGGGGAYSRKSFAVVKNQYYAYSVGAGGTGVASSKGNDGATTTFATTTCVAAGGRGGSPSSGTPPPGGLGGLASVGTGNVKFSGGQGEAGRDHNTGQGGYGGSSAGTAADGYSGPQTFSTITYPTASTPAGAGHGGDGGGAGANGSAPASGRGGGGGGSGDGTTMVGGAGAAGKIILTYPDTPPSVVLNSPVNASTTADNTPTLEFTGTDNIFGDEIGYNLQIGTSSAFESIWSEQTPVGAVNKTWRSVSISNAKMIAGVGVGRLYYYDGSSWSETQPAGNVDKNWYSVSMSDNKIIAAVNVGRLYYHDGASWSEQQPGGNVDKNWYCASISGNKMLAGESPGRLYYYDGASWSEQQPAGAIDTTWGKVSISGNKMLAAVDYGRLYYYDGSSWSETQPAGNVNRNWGDVSISGDKMIAGSYSTGGRLYYYDGFSWSEQQPAGNIDAEWKNVSIYGDKMLAGVYDGRLYYYDGASWSELQPAGAVNKSWYSVSISGDNIFAGVFLGRLYLSTPFLLLNKFSNTDSGFADITSADTDPFTSGDKVGFTIQSGNELPNGTYYWRVSGIDPSGSNVYGPWSATSSFVVSAPAISATGTVYSDEGVSAYNCSANNLTVRLKVNGAGTYSGICTTSLGFFSVNGPSPLSNGDIMTFFLDGETEKAALVTRASGTTANIGGFKLYQNRLIVRHEDGGPVTNANLGQYDKDNDSDLHFTANSSQLLVDSDWGLFVWAGDTYAPGGDATAASLRISPAAAYTGGSEILSLTGSGLGSSRPFVLDSSGTFTANSNTVWYLSASASDVEAANYYNLKMGGSTCGSSISFTYNGSTVTYGTVQALDGNCWMDRNLGATQVASSSADNSSYGDYYQWGRLADGHQASTSASTSTLSSSDVPGHGYFILQPNSPYDWLSPKNDNLWNATSSFANNPCPSGWHVPMQEQWAALIAGEGIINPATAFSSSLKLPVAGMRSRANAALVNQGLYGFYWSSSPTDTYAFNLFIFSGSVDSTSLGNRADGLSVRCLKD